MPEAAEVEFEPPRLLGDCRTDHIRYLRRGI